METTLTPPAPVTPPVQEIDASEAAKVAQSQSRLGIALNLNAWRGLVREGKLTSDDVDELTWLHQFATESGLSRADIGKVLDYDQTVVFRVLSGTYEGSWKNIIAAIKSHRTLIQRERSKASEFRPNPVSVLVHGALDYALANGSITLIVGESRSGKTVATTSWRDAHNHGRSVYVVAPAICSRANFMRRLCGVLGVNKSNNVYCQEEAIMRAFSPARILIVDEAHRLVEGRVANQTILELLRDIHDQTGCGLALIATARFSEAVNRTQYMYEQFEGRIGMPVRIPRELSEQVVLPIVKQYIEAPSRKVMDEAVAIANRPGRLGILVETLKFAQRIARQAKSKVTEEHFFSAIATRRKMMGETMYAAK